jgi:hypothetical protein
MIATIITLLVGVASRTFTFYPECVRQRRVLRGKTNVR